MAEELDIYSDYNTDDIFDEIVNDKPLQKRTRKYNDKEDNEDMRHTKVSIHEEHKQIPQKIQTTTQTYHSPSHSKTQLPTALTQLRGITNTPTAHLYLGELHWYTTDNEVSAPLEKAHLMDYLKEMTFYEHKVNGKSKGIVYLEFTSADYAHQAKDIYDHTEFDHKRVYAAYTTIPNPFKHLPKETSSKPTRTPNNNNNTPRMNTPMINTTYPMINNTTFTNGFGMPPFPFPNMGNRSNFMGYNEMMNMPSPAGRGMRNIRGNTNQYRRGTNGNYMNDGAGFGGMHVNPAFFDQQKHS